MKRLAAILLTIVMIFTFIPTMAGADQSAVQTAIEKINAIGTVNTYSRVAIEQARSAYNGLTDGEKAQVTNLGVLTAAETAFAALSTPMATTYVTLSNCDTTTGWGSVNTVNTDVKTEGNGSIQQSVTTQLMYFFNSSNGFDFTDATHLEFDLYVEDTALFLHGDCGINFSSVGSGSWWEEEGIRVYASALKALTLKEGWNHVKLPLTFLPSPAASFDQTKVTNLRFYAVGITKSSVVRIDDFKIVKEPTGNQAVTIPDDMKLYKPALSTEQNAWVISNCDAGSLTVSSCENNYVVSAGNDTFTAFTALSSGTVEVKAPKLTSAPISITNLNADDLAFKMQFYVSNAAAIRTGQIEITSSGKIDTEELHWTLPLTNAKDGWNEVTLDFAGGVATGGTLNLANINYLRIYMFLEEDTVMAFDDIKIVKKEVREPFDSHTLIATGIYHLGLSTANSSDPQWNNYRYVAQQFVPEQENYYGARIALNLSKGNATVHAEIRKEVNGAPLYSTDVDIVSKGAKATWYALDFGQKMTVTPGEVYYLVYYLTARAADSTCTAYGTHIGSNNAVHPGYTYQMSSGSNIHFTDDTKRLIFGFEMIADQSEFVGTFGDVDEDDTVSSADALEVLKAVVGNVTLTTDQTTQADVDSDLSISSADALYILKKVVGKIEEFPAVGKFYQRLADEVDAQIETIGDITKDNYHEKRAALKNTRQAYDMLPNASQALVTKLDVLDAAQAQWDLVKSQADTLKILFIGNSSTYFNDMPVMFSQIANANGKDVETYSVTLGGRKLIDYMVEDETTLQLKALLAEHSFDICFLQEQTTYPALNYTDYTRGLEYVMNMIGDKADRFIFYATLPRKEGQPELAANNWTPETMNQAVLSGVQKAAQTYGATCSAAGSSILYVMQNYPEINLHDTDLAHPSYRGSCLMTLTHYYTVFGEFPTDTSMLVLSNSEVAAFRATVCR